MAKEIIMPKVDMVMETGTFVEWLKKEGESVQKGEPLFVILTDKAAIEVEAVDSGVLTGVRASPDDVIPVSSVIGYLLRPGESLAEPSLGGATLGPAVATPGSAGVAGTPSTVARAVQEKADKLVRPFEVTESEIRATPLARGIASERKVDLSLVKGSGPRGRIYRADVERFLAATPAATAGDGKEYLLPHINLSGSPFNLPEARELRRIPMKGPRKIIAERMAFSAQTIPHIHVSIEVDMSEAVHLREKLKGYYQQTYGFGVSYTAFVAYSVAHLLSKHPYLNSSLEGDELVLWEDVHLGIAVDLDENLVVPVIRAAQQKKLEVITVEIHQLVERARARKLTPVEMTGSTFTISNLGMLGALNFTAIINPSETAILAVGKIQERPVSAEGGIALRPMMNLTLAVDHRAINGAQATRFLADLKAALENPFLLI